MSDSLKDPMGLAIKDYFNGDTKAVIRVDTNLTEDEELPAYYLFRTFEELPALEKKAIEMTHGKTLDVGCGSGCHSLILQERGIDTKAIDISQTSVEIAKQQGVEKVDCIDFFDLREEKYDSLLFLMNGIGLVQTLDGLDHFFKHVKTLMNEGAQILLDSSDVIYMFEEEDGSFLVNLNDKYFGEMEYYLSYKGLKGEPFKWLYVSFELLHDEAIKHGFKCEKIMDGEHFDYLAKLTL